MVGGALETVLPVPVCAVIIGEVVGAMVTIQLYNIITVLQFIQGIVLMGMSFIDKKLM